MIPDLLYKMAFASVRGMGVDLAQKILDVLGDEKEFFAISKSVFVPPDSFSGEMTPRTGLSTA